MRPHSAHAGSSRAKTRKTAFQWPVERKHSRKTYLSCWDLMGNIANRVIWVSTGTGKEKRHRGGCGKGRSQGEKFQRKDSKDFLDRECPSLMYSRSWERQDPLDVSGTFAPNAA